ncbi:hypothetical protein FUAX_19720 [Fulvitalea axinellae]|uniref:Copper-binding protein MbnP-like domain-containing protein n=1 Tax=Fulvitalea axinellae TaxID=1182444 RepID=A0AAU9DAY9_9BACT|nr:hypothetical protein FUAX_19720 [Fulvitalea axinellae]
MKVKRLLFAYLFFVFAGLLAGLGACSSSDEDANEGLSVKFSHKANGRQLKKGSMEYENKKGEAFEVENLKYYVSDFSFTTSSGNVSNLDTVLYIDINKAETLKARSFPQVQLNDPVTKVAFTFGLDDERNTENGLGRPFNSDDQKMIWPMPMGGGYHYMKIEGRYKSSDGQNKPYNTHTGRLKKDDTLTSHFFRVNLEMPKGGGDLELVMNVEKWYESPNLYSFDYFGKAIMNNLEAQRFLKENGHDVFELKIAE